jgi:integrase
MNAFCRWLHEQGEIPALVKLRPQRLEKRIIDTHGEAALRAILTCRPKTFPHRRVHALVATILDAGCRIEEMLTARVADFDFDNLILTVYGKGRKERRVPFSTEFAEAAVPVRAVQGTNWGQVRIDVPGSPRRTVAEAERASELLLPAQAARPPALRLSSATPHVRNPIPAERWGRGAPLDHPGALRDQHHDEIPPSADRGSPAPASGVVDFESAPVTRQWLIIDVDVHSS